MKKRKPRIYIGINEIGDFGLALAQGFRELGFEATSAALVPDSPVLKLAARHDRYIKRGNNKYTHLLHRIVEFCRVAPFYDIFIFVYTESFFSSSLLASKSRFARWLAYRDLPLLKAMGKKIVAVSNGCDVRHYVPIEKQAKEDGFTYHVCLYCDQRESCSLPLKKKRVEMLERYVDHIVSHPLIEGLFTKPYLIMPLPLNLSALRFSYTSTANPLILHAPTNRPLKGTKYILEAVEKLRKEGYRFRFVLCENMTNDKVRELLEESEIVVDQLMVRGHGLFALEGMASGNVVLSYAIPGVYAYPSDLPIITTNPGNVYQNLKMVLENPELREEKAKAGRAFAEKYHDHVKAARYYLTKLGVLPGTSYTFP